MFLRKNYVMRWWRRKMQHKTRASKSAKQRTSAHPRMMKLTRILKKKGGNNLRATAGHVLLLIVVKFTVMLRGLQKAPALRRPPRYTVTYVMMDFFSIVAEAV